MHSIKLAFFILISTNTAYSQYFTDDNGKHFVSAYNPELEKDPALICVSTKCNKPTKLIAMPVFNTKEYELEQNKIKQYNKCIKTCNSPTQKIEIEKFTQFNSIIRDCELAMTRAQLNYFQISLPQFISKKSSFKNRIPESDNEAVEELDLKASFCEDVRGGIHNKPMLDYYLQSLKSCQSLYNTTKSTTKGVDRLFGTELQLFFESMKSVKAIDHKVIHRAFEMQSKCLSMTPMPSSIEVRTSSRIPKAKFEVKDTKEIKGKEATPR